MSGAQTAHAAMSDARIAHADERAKAILAEMNHTRTRCDDCDMIDPPTDDSGCHDECPSAGGSARLWRAMVTRDGTKLEGIEGLREIANLMIDLVGDVRRSRELAASYDMDHALRDAAEQAELLQHGAERARDEARAEAHRLSARLIAAERERSEDAESTRAAWRESERREQELRDRLIAAERERDALATTLETRTAEHALAMARVAELEAIIAGRTTPPTDAEIEAHAAAGGGRWLVLTENDFTYDMPDAVSRDEWVRVGVVRWCPCTDDGRPCAWPAAVEQAR